MMSINIEQKGQSDHKLYANSVPGKRQGTMQSEDRAVCVKAPKLDKYDGFTIPKGTK